MPQEPWYRDGLRFGCLGCGYCCTGSPGYVWVGAAEIEALAAAMGLDIPQFAEAFVRSVGRRKSLVEMPNGDCVFFDGQTRRCRVYDVRPSQCRTWPFWQSNVRSPRTWVETCRACPGIGQGPFFSCEEIQDRLSIVHA